MGIGDFVVRISDRRILAAVAQAAQLGEEHRAQLFIGLDKLDKIGWDGVRTELVEGRSLPAGPPTGRSS
ncbi:MAG: hypothetical protein ACRDX8_10375 [Acidimicrobiales bacterium]